MNKKDRKIQRDLLNNTMTVEDLVKYLNKLPKSMPVGTIGHYGEFYGMTKFHFDANKSYFERMGSSVEFRVLNIVPIDIGPEPD